MLSEDITFCDNWKCWQMSCERNPNRIRQDIPHSFAQLQGDSRYCPRAALSNVGRPNNGRARKLK